MADKQLRVGQKVEICNKNVRGIIAYVGLTTFAVGKWVGVILDEPVGKNNGTIKGTPYFSCSDNYGMFVRPTQLILLDDSGNPIELASPEEKQSRSRISSSRLSLVGSRQSLIGSRSELASPAAERPPTSQSLLSERGATATIDKKTNISPPEYSSTSKRASFVETDFIETLNPKFTPGQSITGSTTINPLQSDDKLIVLRLQEQNDKLTVDVRDLTEKLDTLKQRRNEDKERLREFDKIKLQFDQLQEFKSKIMDSQSQLQRDLQRSRQETKDAIDAKNQYVEEMSELAENIEMITLDKEMAEEKADTLQLELEAAKEKCEELQLDLEILRTEMQNKGSSETDNISATSYQFKQLESQNARLRETLVRLRDLSAHDKHEIQKVTKELDMKKSEVAELQRTKEKLSAKIDELEAQIVDLQEQVDAALGAEEMVEQLADKKMELEDKVKLLEEEVRELEALEEVHEQLVESNHDLEMDLREELDMALAAKREMNREKDAAFETILDRDQTIMKFRELVQKLNEQLQEWREKTTTTTATNESIKSQQEQQSLNVKEHIVTETIDFKQMFAETKAYTRAIDLQLRQIELSQANEHVRLLIAYMPDTFLNRGGDHDAILIMLLVSRIVYKAGIIVGQVRERFGTIAMVPDRINLQQGHDVQQFGFKSRLLYHMYNLQTVMHQFLYGFNLCNAETLLKAGTTMPEMLAQEKIIDGIIELLRSNQLDENSTTENLEKCIVFFNAMYTVLLANNNLMNETQFLRDCTASVLAACDSINTDSAAIQALIKPGDEISDSGLLLQYVIQTTDSIKQQLKLIKRRLPQDVTIVKCGLSNKTIINLKQISEQLGKSMTALFITCKIVLQIITLSEDSDSSISHTKLMDILSATFEKIYEQDDRGPSQNLKTILTNTKTDMSQMAQYLLDKEYEIMSTQQHHTHDANGKEQTSMAPIVQRSQFIKKQLEETKTLTINLENREAEIKQLKLAAKMKQNELSEMQIRKDLAEKKLSVLQNDHELNTDKLQRKYEEMCQLLKKKEKEFEETMDHLQNDIDSLEIEKVSLKEKLKGYNKEKVDLKTTTAFDITPSSPFIAQELMLLKQAFNNERQERLQLQAEEMKKILNSLSPIFVPQPKDNRISELEIEIARVKKDYLLSLAKGPDYRFNDNNHENQMRLLRNEIKQRAERLAVEVVDEYLQRKPHRTIHGDFSKFPTNELVKALKSQ